MLLLTLLEIGLQILSRQNKGNKLLSLVHCCVASLRHLVTMFIFTVALKVICLLILMHSLEGVHSLLIFCPVKFYTMAKLALTKQKGKSSDNVRR